MNYYKFQFTGRLAGALGVPYACTREVVADDEEAARLALYKTHEDISNLQLLWVRPVNIKCYDNGGETIDRYTVVYLDQPENRPGLYAAIAASAEPFHPQGFGQHTTAMVGDHLGREVPFEELPAKVQQMVRQDFID